MQLNYKYFGQGEPVIIMHGLFGMLDNWQTIARKLSENFMVFIVDLRNHGRSEHADEFDYVCMAEDICELMESIGMYAAHIVGHSMGGKVAMQLAQDHSDMVNKLAIVDIAPKNYQGNHQEIFKALFDLDFDRISSRKEADLFLQTRIKEFGVRQFLLKNIYLNKETRKYGWRMNLPVIYENYQKILEHEIEPDAFDGETIFIRGGLSDYVDETELERYQEYFPNASLQTIKGAGHWVHAEKPEPFFEALKAFLED